MLPYMYNHVLMSEYLKYYVYYELPEVFTP
jgi:hypothetical protein